MLKEIKTREQFAIRDSIRKNACARRYKKDLFSESISWNALKGCEVDIYSTITTKVITGGSYVLESQKVIIESIVEDYLFVTLPEQPRELKKQSFIIHKNDVKFDSIKNLL